MLILLPPSEGKAAPRRGRPMDPADWPDALRAPRLEVIEALVSLCRGAATEAARVLGLGPSQLDEVARDAELYDAPAGPAERVYTGVLYEALDLPSLAGPALRRARSTIRVTSSLFGLVRPAERIPAYRLSGAVTLPGLGGVAAHWRRHLDPVVREAAGSGLLVDLRSSTYAGFWRPTGDVSPRVVTVRVLHEVKGRRQVVSHFNKATKGRLVRALLESGASPKRPAQLADAWRDLGWTVEQDATRLDVVVSDL